VAQRRFAQDEEEQQRHRAEKEVRAQPVATQRWREKSQNKSDQGHEEGRNGAEVHELILKVMPREDLAKPVLETHAGGMAGRGRR
jgi:hypothetical protein